MAKITRTKLARGTKLTPDHTHGLLQNAATQMNAASVEVQQLEADSSSFRVNWYFPNLSTDFPFGRNFSVSSTLQSLQKFCIPFTLPPTQDYFDADGSGGKLTRGQPSLSLEEVSFSFDQRGEGAAIVSARAANGTVSADAGKLDFEEVRAYDMDISLVEKEQLFFDSGQVDYKASKVIFNAPMSSLSFSGNDLRFNPFTVTDINATISPFKTYAFVLSAPLLDIDADAVPAKTRAHSIVSAHISLKFRSLLLPRDVHSAADPVQNIPMKDGNLTVRSPSAIGQAVTITSPGAGTAIVADSDTDGLSKNIEHITSEFRHKLSGGVDEFCETAARQMLKNDAGYEVIAIPLLNNRTMGGIVSAYALANEPWGTATNAIWDRSVVPLNYPMVIHHVILAWNWQKFYCTGPAPMVPDVGESVPGVLSGTGNNFVVEVGLGIGEGIQSDSFGYQQIASHTLTEPWVAATGYPAATWDSRVIDRFTCNQGVGNGAIRPIAGVNDPQNWEWELHQMDIVNAAAPWLGEGYYQNGRPFFTGKSWSPTATRNNVAGGTASDVGGREQFLEARIKITYGGGAFPNNNEVVSGYQGHWIYVIGKKYLTR